MTSLFLILFAVGVFSYVIFGLEEDIREREEIEKNILYRIQEAREKK